jgi:hypothetical protein
VEPRRVCWDSEVLRRDAYVVPHLTTGHSSFGHGLRQQLRGGDLCGGQSGRTGIYTGQIQEVGRECREPLRLVERRTQCDGVRLGDSVDEVLEYGAQRGERRT